MSGRRPELCDRNIADCVVITISTVHGWIRIGAGRKFRVVLSDIDRRLLERCLAKQARSWEDFVDRFLGLVLHVISHTAQSRSVRLTPQDREDLAAEVFLGLINDDFAVLRRFRGESSLATYLTVIARRIVVKQLGRRSPSLNTMSGVETESAYDEEPEQRISDHEEVARLMSELNGPEAEVVRMYHLEGRSYGEISDRMNMPENSIGPTLSRARSKMRRAGAQT
ncbi:MAG: sigma-70 family RNA polymerase sigma factor [Planctomycetales bacterium]|nr:sigma-70 family RNA polymerase sigma factor [Planctomycetales bacterium]